MGRLLRHHPNAVLALAAAGILAVEYLFRTRGDLYGPHPSPRWLIVEAIVALAVLAYAWHVQDRLRFWPVLALALAFQLVWIVIHLHLGVLTDDDTRRVYGPEGDALLHGHYPRSEYPPAAVVLFALEKALDPAHIATANRLLMVPFQLATVGAIWSLRTRGSAWLAVVIALWPMDAYHWEFRYDLVPTAFLVGGLALAFAGRWGWAGLALGVGTAAKWTPALAFAVLAVWCVVNSRLRPAIRLTLAFAAGLLAFYLPFVGWASSQLGAAYTHQGGRPLTAESLWYLPLHALGQTRFTGIPLPAGAPHWADVLAGTVQGVLVLALIAVAALVRRFPAVVALAALTPVVFLVTNRIFSAQYLVLMLAAWAVAAAMVCRNRREQGAVMLVALLATVANAFVFPFILWNRDRTWVACSTIMFVLSVAVTGWLLALALRARATDTPWRST